MLNNFGSNLVRSLLNCKFVQRNFSVIAAQALQRYLFKFFSLLFYFFIVTILFPTIFIQDKKFVFLYLVFRLSKIKSGHL